MLARTLSWMVLLWLGVAACRADYPLASLLAPHQDAQGDPLPAEALARLGSRRWRQPLFVYSVAYAADGRQVISAGRDGSIRFWDPASGRELRRWQVAQDKCLHGLAVSRDGKLLATLQGDTLLFDMENGRLRQQIDNSDHVRTAFIALSPDGQTLASVHHQPVWKEVAERNAVRFHDTANGQLIRQFTPAAQVEVVFFTPDGRRLIGHNGANSVNGGDVFLWDVATGRELKRLGGSDVHSLSGTPDGKLLVLGDKKGNIRVLDAGTLDEVRSWFIGTKECIELACLADGGRLLASNDRFLEMWDLVSGRKLRQYGPLPMYIGRLAPSPDGQRVAIISGYGNVIEHLDLDSAEPFRAITGHRLAVTDLTYSSDGWLLASLGWPEENVLVWEAATGQLLRTCRTGDQASIHAIAFMPNGSLAGAGKGPRARVKPPFSEYLFHWDPATGRTISSWRRPIEYNQISMPCRPSFRTDGNYVASMAVVRETATGREVWQGNALFLYRDDRLLSFEQEDPESDLLLLDVVRNRLLCRVRQEHKQGLRPFERLTMWENSLSQDGRLLLTASFGIGAWVEAWEVRSGQRLCRLPMNTNRALLPEVSPNGRWLAWVDDRGTLSVCELGDGAIVQQFRPDEGEATALKFAPDGRSLAAGYQSGTILIWNLDKLPPLEKPDAAMLDDLWKALASADANQAYRAMSRLGAGGDLTSAELGRRLRPVRPVEADRLARLLADLHDRRFEVRQQATEELDRLAELAEPALRQELLVQETLEARHRIEQLLRRLVQGPLTAERLQAVRGIEVLERIGTPAARAVLRELAGGYAEALQTQEARTALSRLEK